MIDAIRRELRLWHIADRSRRVVCVESGARLEGQPDRWTWAMFEDGRQVGLISTASWGVGGGPAWLRCSGQAHSLQLGARDAEQPPPHDYGAPVVPGRVA